MEVIIEDQTMVHTVVPYDVTLTRTNPVAAQHNNGLLGRY